MLNTFGNYNLPILKNDSKSFTRQQKSSVPKVQPYIQLEDNIDTKTDLKQLPRITHHLSASRMNPFMPHLNPEHQLNFRKLQYDQEFQLINMLQKHYEDQMSMLAALMNPPKPQSVEKPPSLDYNSTKNQFKPYTLAQYRKLKEIPVLHNGRLGPQLPVEEWSILKVKRDKMYEYAENVKLINDQKMRNKTHTQSQLGVPQKEKGVRQIGNTYASLIPLPKIKRPASDSDISQSEFLTQTQDLLSQYDRRNQFDRQAVARISQ